MRWNNETPIPRPPTIESGVNISIPSRDDGRSIPLRMFKPEACDAKGVMLHIHGGGWVLMSEHYQDAYLKWVADEIGIAVLSVGYRLAPEHPFPACSDDCVDAAEYLLKNGASYGGELLFIGGEVSLPTQRGPTWRLRLTSSSPVGWRPSHDDYNPAIAAHSRQAVAYQRSDLVLWSL
jgi:hypothetical protein